MGRALETQSALLSLMRMHLGDVYLFKPWVYLCDFILWMFSYFWAQELRFLQVHLRTWHCRGLAALFLKQCIHSSTIILKQWEKFITETVMSCDLWNLLMFISCHYQIIVWSLNKKACGEATNKTTIHLHTSTHPQHNMHARAHTHTTHSKIHLHSSRWARAIKQTFHKQTHFVFSVHFVFLSLLLGLRKEKAAEA